jgi:very-short-patch-repair endonuclease
VAAAIHRSSSDQSIGLLRPHPLSVNAHVEVNALIQAGGGLVTRRDHPELAGSFDWLLREGRLATVLPGVYAAPAIAESWRLTPHRAGNRERLELLIDSRGETWSAAERLGHRLLRTARIKGWQPNLPVLIDGQVFYIDIAFKQQKLAIEIDGRLHETAEDLFESDRWRQNALVADGWRVLRFTWAMLREHPDVFLSAVLDALH